MRTRHAAALSVVAVLTAGVAAAIVNTQALAGHGAHTNDVLSSMPTPNDATPSGGVTTVSSATTQQVFTVGDAGRWTLDRKNGVLVVISLAPANGWRVAGVTHVNDSEIAVELTSPTDRVTASAVVTADGIIVVTVAETTSTPGPVPLQPSSSPTTATPSAVTTADPGGPTSTRTASATPTTHQTKTDEGTPSTPASESPGDHSEPDD